MKRKLYKILVAVMCVCMLLNGFPTIHINDGHDGHDHENESIIELGWDQSVTISSNAYVDYEDGFECEHCGGYLYGDWPCDSGDHCGEDSGHGTCYEDWHCKDCGDCMDNEDDLCEDCDKCLEECCECDNKCALPARRWRRLSWRTN